MEEDKTIRETSGASAADSSEHTTGVQSPQQAEPGPEAGAASASRKEPADGQPEQAAEQADKQRSSDRTGPQGNRHDPQRTQPAGPQSGRGPEPRQERQAVAQQEEPSGSPQKDIDSEPAAEPQSDRRASRRSGQADRAGREDRSEGAAHTGNASENAASTARSARAGRETRSDRVDRSGHDDRGTRSDNADRADRAENPNRLERRADRTGNASENASTAPRSARGDREARPDSADRSGRDDRDTRSDRSGRGDRTGHAAGNTPAATRTNRSETSRNARSGAPKNSDGSARSEAAKASAASARSGASKSPQAASRANASARAAASERGAASARRNRTSEPAWRSDAKSPRHRSWREYALQFLVVILGVVVTFIGSGVIDRWRTQREVKAVMHLVCEELKTDRQMASEICRSIAYDRRGMVLMQEHGMDYRRVPVDSLAVYQNILGQIEHFKPRTDALEVLRTSGAITRAEDKVLLMKILECYSLMNDFSESVDTYNDLKMKAIDHLFSEGLKGNIGGEDPSESWQVVMSDPKCAAFIGSTGNFFKDYALPEGIVEPIDEVIGTLNDKYRFE